MKKLILFTSWIFLSCFISSTVAAIQPPESVIKETADSVLERVKNERDELRDNPQLLNQMVDELIVPHFDFRRMSRWVVGKHWRKLTKEQQNRFILQFRKLLVRTYSSALLEYRDEKIKYYPVHAAEDAKTVTVKTALEQAGAPSIPISYKMHSKDGTWKVYDVTVDGVSLVSTYRGSFATEIKQNGIDALINKLEKKNTQ